MIDKMLERHPGRVDNMIHIVDALAPGRIDAERMEPRLILALLDDEALRERRREAAGEGNNLEMRRVIDRD